MLGPFTQHYGHGVTVVATILILYNNNNNNKKIRKLADQSGDDREIRFLLQRLSVLFQRYNAIVLHDCFVKEEEE